jgi:O-antigen ligase
LAAATLLGCRGPAAPGASGSAPGDRLLLDRLLTVPVSMTGPSDIRDHVLAFGLAGLLLLRAIDRRTTLRGGTGQAPGSTAPSAWRPPWLEVFSLLVVVIAAASASANHTWDISTGWIFRLTVGLGWAVLLARTADDACLRGIALGGCIVAILSAAGALWSRHEAGSPLVDVPIGPVTLCAGLAALWAAGAMGWVAGWLLAPTAREANRRSLLIAGSLLIIALLLLRVSARWGAWLAVLAGASLSAVVLCLAWTRSRRLRIAFAICLAGVALAGTGAVIHRVALRDDRSLAAGSVRLVYWREALDRLVVSPLLGAGPDRFVCDITTSVAYLRARTPRFLQGVIDSAAHNEWLQAAYELGLPGGLLYLAIPAGVIFAAARRSLSRRAEAPLLLSGAAGLLAIVVGEATSINLRYASLPPWYWTLLGATAAALRGSWAAQPLPIGRSFVVQRLAPAALAIPIVLLAWRDARCAIAHAAGRAALVCEPATAAGHFRAAVARLGAERRLETAFDLGAALLEDARAAGAESDQRRLAAEAESVLRELVSRCPAYPDASYSLAASQLLMGGLAEAAATLDDFFHRVNPYDPLANLLYVDLPGVPAPAQLDCLRRALREADIDPVIEARIRRLFSGRIPAGWVEQVAVAGEDLARRPPEAWQDPLAPETIRLDGHRLFLAGRLVEAEQQAARAATAYARLVETRAGARRQAPAEADAWRRAAEYLLALNPANWPEALRRVRLAESFLVAGVEELYAPDPDPGADILAGPGAPAQFPERFEPLWRLSATLHLIDGRMDAARRRATLGLPEHSRGPGAEAAEIRLLAQQAVALLESLTADRRPPAYGELRQLAR